MMAATTTTTRVAAGQPPPPPPPPTSPIVPDFTENPLIFQPEWLKPTVNDIHSRSRLQCLMLAYLRTAIGYLVGTVKSELKENPRWKTFIDPLKMFTALEACQPPPLRAALARLWVVYLASSETGQLVTAASWLLEQLRVLYNTKSSIPPQATVFAECAGLVFVEFRKTLLPMAPDCAINLMKLCQNYTTNYAVAVVASEGLVALTTTGTIFLGASRNDLAIKVAIPLIESKSARLRCNGASIMINLFFHSFSLGTIARKSLKNRAEEMLRSSCREEQVVAAELLAHLISFKSNGELQKIDSMIESWVKLVDRHANFDVWTAKVLVSSLKHFKDNVDTVIMKITREQTLSLAIVPESKKRVWKISSLQLRIILKEIINVIPEVGLAEFSNRLLQIVEPELLEATYSWYLHGVKSGRITLPESELLRLPLRFSSSIKLCLMTAEAISLLAEDSSVHQRLVLSIFAQLKGDWTILALADSTGSTQTFQSYALTLSALLSSTSTDGYGPLHRSREFLEQIRDWVLDLLGKRKLLPSLMAESIQDACWAILGGLIVCAPNIVDFLNLVKSIDEGNISILRDSTTTRLLSSSSTTIAATSNHVDLKIGLLVFIKNIFRAGLANDLVVTLFKKFSPLVVEQWRAYSGFSDASYISLDQQSLLMLSEVTLLLMKLEEDGLSEVAATVSSRLLCDVDSIDENLKENCQSILVGHFSQAAVAGQKYHLSQFGIFVKNLPVRETIFRTVAKLMKVIRLREKTGEDQVFILDTLKEIIFPFVCDTNGTLQELATVCLGQLVYLVDSREFRDGMLQELIDRALNEPKEFHRRGYILGIGQVYAAFPEQGSHLDIGSMMGLLSSLAKDPRSLVVQAAAIDSLYKVLDSRSNSVATILTSDIVYLIWQIYMNDPNSLPVESAVERLLLDSIARTLLVLIEMMGPDLNESNTVPRICRLMVGEFLEYDCQDQDLLRLFFEAAMQILLVCQRVEALPALLSAIHGAFLAKDKANLTTAISCFRWLLEFHRSVVVDFITPSLISSLFNLFPTESTDLDFCAQALFENNFQVDPRAWLMLIENAKILKPLAQNSSGSAVSLEHEVMLLGSDLNMTSIDGGESFKTPLSPLGSIEALERVIELIICFLKEKGAGIHLLWSEEICNTLITDIIRQGMCLVMISTKTATLSTKRFKIAGIRLVTALIENCSLVPDWLDDEAFLLDTYQSQLVTIYSTSTQDPDVIVAGESFAALARLVGSCSISRHPKVRLLINKALEMLQLQGTRIFQSEPVELYSKALISSNLWSIIEKWGHFSEKHLVTINETICWCIENAIDMFVDGNLDQLILNLFPSLANARVSKGSTESNEPKESKKPNESKESKELKKPFSNYEIIGMFSLLAADAGRVKGVSIYALAGLLQRTATKVNPIDPIITGECSLWILECAVRSEDDSCNCAVFDCAATLFEYLPRAKLENLFNRLLNNILIRQVYPLRVVLAMINGLGRDPALLSKFWPAIFQTIYGLLMSGLEAEDFARVTLALFKSSLSVEQKDDLYALIFGSELTNVWKLQVLIGIIPKIDLKDKDELVTQSTLLMRRTLESDPLEAGQLWMLFLKSSHQQPLMSSIAINSLDLILELLPSKSPSIVDPTKVLPLLPPSAGTLSQLVVEYFSG